MRIEKDCGILGSILGCLYFWKLPNMVIPRDPVDMQR